MEQPVESDFLAVALDTLDTLAVQGTPPCVAVSCEVLRLALRGAALLEVRADELGPDSAETELLLELYAALRRSPSIVAVLRD